MLFQQLAICLSLNECCFADFCCCSHSQTRPRLCTWSRLSACLSVYPVCALTFESFGPETSLLVCRPIFRIPRSSSDTRLSGQGQGHSSKKQEYEHTHICGWSGINWKSLVLKHLLLLHLLNKSQLRSCVDRCHIWPYCASGCKPWRWMLKDMSKHGPIWVVFNDLKHVVSCRFTT